MKYYYFPGGLRRLSNAESFPFSQRGMTKQGRGYCLKLIRKYVVFVTDLFKLPACILDISKARMELKDRCLAVEGTLSAVRMRHRSHI
jgi:hypothetical protein